MRVAALSPLFKHVNPLLVGWRLNSNETNLWISNFNVTGSSFKCFMLDKPSTQGFSRGPVIGFEGTGEFICYGIIHGTRQDNTGGKLAIVVHSAYLYELIEYAKKS